MNVSASLLDLFCIEVFTCIKQFTIILDIDRIITAKSIFIDVFCNVESILIFVIRKYIYAESSVRMLTDGNLLEIGVEITVDSDTDVVFSIETTRKDESIFFIL